MKMFFIAIQFLTILPVRFKRVPAPKDFGRSLLYFPFTGTIIGLILASVSFFPSNVISAVLILIVSVVITGGIHLDGFADTCDGFYGGRSKEEILKIMRDPHIGTVGVIGLVCLFLFKFGIFMSIPVNMLWKMLILSMTFSRWCQALACYTTGYARMEGKAKYFIEYAGKKEVFFGGLFTSALFIYLFRIDGLFLFFIPLLPVLFFMNFVNKKIGGMTGDTIGAANEVAEISSNFTFYALLVLSS